MNSPANACGDRRSVLMPVVSSPAGIADGPTAELLDAVNRWCLGRLVDLNGEALAGRCSPRNFTVIVADEVMPLLPPAHTLSQRQLRQALVLAGLLGSSILRHHQQHDRAAQTDPPSVLRSVPVGDGTGDLLAYVAEVAARSDTGHPPRDAYASFARWNTPAAVVAWHGQRSRLLPGSFDDRAVRTYTGDPGEVAFLMLLKRAEAVEQVVNDLVEPLVTGGVDLATPDSIDAMRNAAGLLHVLTALNSGFTASVGGSRWANHFMDVFRQFAVHWRVGDVPPSGAQDAEFLRRDLLLGIDLPDYPRHVHRVFPALLDSEREMLRRLFGATPLPAMVLARAGTSVADLASMSSSDLLDLTADHPALVACYELMRANDRVASSHLGLVKRLLFNPQRARDRRGAPDGAVVSNWSGTTGMLEGLLDALTAARKRHPLAVFRALPADELARAASLPPTIDVRQIDAAEIVWIES